MCSGTSCAGKWSADYEGGDSITEFSMDSLQGDKECSTYGSSHGLSLRLATPLACCRGWAEGLEAIHPVNEGIAGERK